MRKSFICLAALACCGAAAAVACDSQGTIALPYQDGGPDTSTSYDGSTPFDAGMFVDSAAPADGGADASDAGPPPPSRLLLSYNGASSSELVAFGLQSKAVDGRMTYPDYLGTAYVGDDRAVAARAVDGRRREARRRSSLGSSTRRGTSR